MNIIIVGGGKKIHFLIKSFVSKGHKVTIINNELDVCKQLSRMHNVPVIYGDGSLPRYLEEAGAAYSEVVIALTSKDPDNLVVCQVAQRMFKIEKTFAIVNDPDNIKTFKDLGVDTVISTADIISSLIEQRVSIDEITNIIPIEAGKIAIMEIEINSDSPVVGKRMRELNLPQESVVGCIFRKEDAVIPRGETDIRLNDKLLVLALPEVQSEVLEVIRGRV
ncbi:MAG: potassium channel family protein [Clostridia bacterium]